MMLPKTSVVDLSASAWKFILNVSDIKIYNYNILNVLQILMSACRHDGMVICIINTMIQIITVIILIALNFCTFYGRLIRFD